MKVKKAEGAIAVDAAMSLVVGSNPRVPGTSASELARGSEKATPGMIYEIDSTVPDIWLVAETTSARPAEGESDVSSN